MEINVSPETIETGPSITEEMSVIKIKKLMKKGVDVSDVVQGLAGMNSEETWKLREKFLRKNKTFSTPLLFPDAPESSKLGMITSKYRFNMVKNGIFARGLAGLDNDRSWEIRDWLFSGRAEPYLVVMGLSGIDSQRAWDMREKIMSRNYGPYAEVNISSAIQSLIGLDNDRAWEMREQALELRENMQSDYSREYVSLHWFARGLAGLDSDRAWKMRDKLLEAGADEGHIAIGLAGLDCDQAWKMRKKLLKREADLGFVGEGLAGLDSKRAWEMREILLKDGANTDYVAKGLAGLDNDRAWNMRKHLLKAGADKGAVTEGINGNHITFVWKLLRKKITKTEIAETHAIRTKQQVQSQIS